jgi:superfamily II DNA or RNA helicase
MLMKIETFYTRKRKEMSIVVPKNILTADKKNIVREKCRKTINDKLYRVYKLYKDSICLPISFARQQFKTPTVLYPRINIKCSILPKSYQIDVITETLDLLNKGDNVILNVYTGFGKTATSIYLISRLQMKTVIIVFNKTIRQQWKEEINRFCTNVKAEINSLDVTNDILIVGPKKASQIKSKDIGIVIIDEMHICTETIFLTSLFNFQPKHLIGLSATIDRPDNLHSIFSLFFSVIIHRQKVKDFTVYKIKTQFQPDIEYIRYRGEDRIDWNLVTNSLACNKERIQLIVKLTQQFKDRKILILCSRISIINSLFEQIKKIDSTDTISENKTKYNEKARVLIGSMKKVGVGFNNTNIDMLIMASDCKDCRQFEGRIRVDNNIIVDIVDDHPVLERHWQLRRQWYVKRGAKIRKDLKIDN